MRLAVLAQRVGGELVGDPGIEIEAVVAPEDARPGTVVVLTDPRRLAEVEAGHAAVILPRDAPATSLPSIRVEETRMALALAIRALVPAVAPPPPGVHPTCVIGSGTRIGAGVYLGPYVVVGDEVTIGDRSQIHAHGILEQGVVLGADCVLHSRVTIRHGCSLGSRVIVQSGTIIGSDGFGYAQDARRRHVPIPQVGRVVIGDDVEIGANVAIDRAMLGVTRIGRGTKLDNLIQIAHNVQIGEDCAFAAAVFIAGSARIGDRVLIGGFVGIKDHVEIADDAIVMADTGVWREVPAGTVVAGHPAQPRFAERRSQAVYQRLPALVRQLRELAQRVRRLERR
jgi:UDP-3-O-[3-hydroxymyristoyl] glucosamine N-acyltransferase